MDSSGIHRPRNVDWKRAAAILYGDWGTSKAYVIGLAFLAAKFASFPIILAVCALTALVGYNYVIVCKYFPDGGGVYSAARHQSRLLAVIGALLLVADLTVTASLSGWSAISYFAGMLHITKDYFREATIFLIIVVGLVNYFGPKHSGSLAVSLAIPTVFVVIVIVGCSLPYLTFANLQPSHESFRHNWVDFVKVILALSGVEAIANLTGVMKLDEGSSMEHPKVSRTAAKAIWPVALEVVGGTAILGWAMLSMPRSMEPKLLERFEDMLSLLGEYYVTLATNSHIGHLFAAVVGIVVGLLLLSAVNTAVTALIGLLYLLARDGEMPKSFNRLNSHGVPWWPMAIATILPLIVLMFSTDLESLADLYAIGVVGAIAVNLGTCTFNRKLHIAWYDRMVMGTTFLVLAAVELTIAKTKPDALFFAVCILGVGLSLRWYSHKRAGLRTVTVSEAIAAHVAPESAPDFRLNLQPGQSILVAARGITPVLSFALEEARLRDGKLYVLYVKELAVSMPGPMQQQERPRWQDDKQAAMIMSTMLEAGRENNVPVIPIFTISDDTVATILDLSATLGIDLLVLGSPNRSSLVALLKGNVVGEVAKNLPENIKMIIYG